MKIAIPTKENKVDDHFGHCEYYTIFSVTEDNKLGEKEIYESPKGCGCKSDVAQLLKDKGVDTMLAGNMGQGAVQKVSNAGINVIRGCEGDVESVSLEFLRGQIIDSGLLCNHHHEDGHQCNH